MFIAINDRAFKIMYDFRISYLIFLFFLCGFIKHTTLFFFVIKKNNNFRLVFMSIPTTICTSEITDTPLQECSFALVPH